MMQSILNIQNMLNNKPDKTAFGFLCRFMNISYEKKQTINVSPPISKERVPQLVHFAYVCNVQFIFAKFGPGLPEHVTRAQSAGRF